MQEPAKTIQTKERQHDSSPKRKKRRDQRPPIPWWVKVSLSLVLLFIALIGGLITGYSIVGDRPMHEVFQIETYKHMYDLVFQE